MKQSLLVQVICEAYMVQITYKTSLVVTEGSLPKVHIYIMWLTAGSNAMKNS